MRKTIFIMCFLVISILGANFAFAENVKHKRLSTGEHKVFLEKKKMEQSEMLALIKEKQKKQKIKIDTSLVKYEKARKSISKEISKNKN